MVKIMNLRWWIGIAFMVVVPQLFAVVIQIPTSEGTELKEETNTPRIDPEMRMYVDDDTSVINPVHRRIYRFNNARIGSYFLCGEKDGTWHVKNENAEDVCLLNILIYPSKHDATQAALDGNMNRDTKKPYGKKDTIVEKEGENLFYRYRPRKGPSENTSVDAMTRNGVLFIYIKQRLANGQLLNVKEQKKLLSLIMDTVLSGKSYRNEENELARIKNKQREVYCLKTYPDYRMSPSIASCYHSHRIWHHLPEGDKTFKEPQKMWNRPNRVWLGQFVVKGRNTFMALPWNERGDMVTIDIPKNQTGEKCHVRFFVAHTISEYNALRFMEGFVYNDVAYQSDMSDASFIQKHRVNPRLVGEYDLALKPQLDATGALIPNAEESDICFVRNNTAVRVVADRPDVSVLWIARKIDEELIAAGKGEPPTWTPPKAPASAPASTAGSR